MVKLDPSESNVKKQSVLSISVTKHCIHDKCCTVHRHFCCTGTVILPLLVSLSQPVNQSMWMMDTSLYIYIML